jgi:hypothetical protein
MSEEHSLVRMPQRTIELPDRERLRVIALFDGVALQHLNAVGELTATIAVSEPVALARLLRHGGAARTLSYRGESVPIAVTREGLDGYLLARELCVPLSKAASREIAETLDPWPEHLQPERAAARQDWPPHAYGLHETATSTPRSSTSSPRSPKRPRPVAVLCA